jgi:hypothetical protein
MVPFTTGRRKLWSFTTSKVWRIAWGSEVRPIIAVAENPFAQLEEEDKQLVS